MAEAVTFGDVVGTVTSYTVIRVPTPEFAQEAPYGLAVIQTADGERMLVRVPAEDAELLAVGITLVYDHQDDHGQVFRIKS